MPSLRHLHATVRGLVQTVGFRYFVVGRARALRLTGWVRNGDDGKTVEVVAEGEPDALRQLEVALRTGPPHAHVEAVDSQWSDVVDGYASFDARL